MIGAIVGLAVGLLAGFYANYYLHKQDLGEREAYWQSQLQPRDEIEDGPYRHTCAGARGRDSVAVAACEMRIVAQQQEIDILRSEVDLLRFCGRKTAPEPTRLPGPGRVIRG